MKCASNDHQAFFTEVYFGSPDDTITRIKSQIICLLHCNRGHIPVQGLHRVDEATHSTEHSPTA